MKRVALARILCRYLHAYDDSTGWVALTPELDYPIFHLSDTNLVYWFVAWVKEQLYYHYSVRIVEDADGFLIPYINKGRPAPDGFGDCWVALKEVEWGEVCPGDQQSAADAFIGVAIRTIETLENIRPRTVFEPTVLE